MTSRKGLNTITSSSGVVLNITNKTLAGKAIADFPELASTDNAKGASLIGIEDSGSLISATTVEAALAENRALINSNSLGLGAFWECVYVIATSNVTLSGEQTIDGVSTSASRVLLTGQTDASENGLWLTDSSNWSRTSDANESNEYTINKTTCAMAGSRAGEVWAYTGSSSPTLDTDDLTFVRKAGSNIADGAITAAKLASDAVTTAKILDANVTRAKIAADAIDGSKIADDSIDSEHIVDGSIDTAHIGDSQITLAKMAANSVDSDQYVDGSIDTAHIADSQVTAVKTNFVGTLDSSPSNYTPADASLIADHLKAIDDEIEGSNKVFVSDITYEDAGVNVLINNAPNGSHLMEALVRVDTAFDGSATLKLGVASDDDAVASTSDIDLSSTADQPQVMSCFFTLSSTENVIATLAGTSMSAGACKVAIRRVK